MTDASTAAQSEVRDGMLIEWDVPIVMDDDLRLRADVFRPVGEGQCPVLMNHGPYAKGLSFQEGYPDQWEILTRDHPDVSLGTTNMYQAWEAPDPEHWVPHGYACVRVDSRGTGRSPGKIDSLSRRETQDYYNCIEWAGTRPWSNGKVGLTGISYYAMNQWHVAALRPPHLAAICPWEGAADWYRDATHHGGILTPWWGAWLKHQVATVQFGCGSPGSRSTQSGLSFCGDVTLGEEELERGRVDLAAQIRAHPLLDEYYRERTAELGRIEVPLLSAGNWGGHGLHLRGNTEGFIAAGSKLKWLELHGLEHFALYYTEYGRELQRCFFDHFLRGEDNGWERRPRVQLNIRHVDGSFTLRREANWPIPRTSWQRLYLNPASRGLSRVRTQEQSALSYEGLAGGVTFHSDALDEQMEITGPLAAKLWISSTTCDADLFLVLRIVAPDGSEVTFQGTDDAHQPPALGWLRASHRKLAVGSTDYRPLHAHDAREPLEPGNIYQVEIELWPTSVVVPAGYRIGLSIQGRDFRYVGDGPEAATWAERSAYCIQTGVGPYTHDDPIDRPADVFGGTVSVFGGAGLESSLLLPIIPEE